MYYIAVSTNFIARILWTLTISPGSIGIILDPNIFNSILAGIEILRRAQWNIYRLENEQLNNVGKYRAVKELPIPIEKAKLYQEFHGKIIEIGLNNRKNIEICFAETNFNVFSVVETNFDDFSFLLTRITPHPMYLKSPFSPERSVFTEIHRQLSTPIVKVSSSNSLIELKVE